MTEEENRGKKPGTLNQYSIEEFELKKAEAKALYLSGKNPNDIDEILCLKRGKTASWAHRLNWAEERSKVLGEVSNNRLQEILKQQEETFKELRIIRDKAIDSIIADEVVPMKFSEATSAYLNTVELERKLKNESIQMNFITDVAKVLKDRIQDRQLLNDIAEGLKEVFNRYQQNSLKSEDKIIDEE